MVNFSTHLFQFANSKLCYFVQNVYGGTMHGVIQTSIAACSEAWLNYLWHLLCGSIRTTLQRSMSTFALYLQWMRRQFGPLILLFYPSSNWHNQLLLFSIVFPATVLSETSTSFAITTKSPYCNHTLIYQSDNGLTFWLTIV